MIEMTAAIARLKANAGIVIAVITRIETVIGGAIRARASGGIATMTATIVITATTAAIEVMVTAATTTVITAATAAIEVMVTAATTKGKKAATGIKGGMVK